MNNIIIFGANGFVGQNLTQYLSDKAPNLKLNTIDARQYNWLPTNTAVGDVYINLIGKAHDHQGTATEQEYDEANHQIVKKIYSDFINSQASLLIHVSSIAAVEEEQSLAPIQEDALPNPISHYGKTKRKAEEFLLAQELPQGKKIIIIRPTMIHGPGDKGNLRLLYNIVKKNIPYPLGAFENQRNFLGIDNFNYIICEIIKQKNTINSGLYNLADDQPVATNQIIQWIGLSLNKKTRILKLPKSILIVLAKIGDFTKLPLNTKRLTKMTSNLLVSNQKIKSALNIQQMPFTAEQGLIKTIKSFQE